MPGARVAAIVKENETNLDFLREDILKKITEHYDVREREFTPERMRQHFERMNQYRADVIVAYTNPLYEFARSLSARGLRP